MRHSNKCTQQHICGSGWYIQESEVDATTEKKKSFQISRTENNKKDNNLMMLLLAAVVITSECEIHYGHIQLNLVSPTRRSLASSHTHTHTHIPRYAYLRVLFRRHAYGFKENRNSEG